jgi:hypothetical protein
MILNRLVRYQRQTAWNSRSILKTLAIDDVKRSLGLGHSFLFASPFTTIRQNHRFAGLGSRCLRVLILSAIAVLEENRAVAGRPAFKSREWNTFWSESIRGWKIARGIERRKELPLITTV